MKNGKTTISGNRTSDLVVVGHCYLRWGFWKVGQDTVSWTGPHWLVMSSLPLGTSIFTHGLCKHLKRKGFERKIYYKRCCCFPTFPSLFATFMLTAWVSLIQTTQAINTPTNPSPLARTLRPIYSAVDYIANSSSHFLPIWSPTLASPVLSPHKS